MAEQAKVVEFRSDDEHDLVVRVAFEPSRVDSELDLFKVQVRAPDLTCDHSALSFKGDDLSAFFADLERDWRGWADTRRWDALEYGMSIEATHRGRVVELLFILRRDYKPDAWELRLPISIAPGEPLARMASEVRSLFEPAR
jgi:hypothetical protein